MATMLAATCADFAEILAPAGFVSREKNQRLRYGTGNDDVVCEIYLQSSFRNTASQVMLQPLVWMRSRAVKTWKSNLTRGPHELGTFFALHLNMISKNQAQNSWAFTAQNVEPTLLNLAEEIRSFAVPIFAYFSEPATAISFMREHGARFHPWMQQSLMPLDYMLVHAKREDAEAFLRVAVAQSSHEARLREHFAALVAAGKKPDLNHNSFVGESAMNTAYVCGLTL